VWVPLALERARRKAPLVVSVVWDSADNYWRPLRLRLGNPVEGQNRVANLILSHMPRIGRLSFTLLGFLADATDVLEGRLGGPAPQLESLSIHCEHENVLPDVALRLMPPSRGHEYTTYPPLHGPIGMERSRATNTDPPDPREQP